MSRTVRICAWALPVLARIVKISVLVMRAIIDIPYR
ncbi:conserved hypothetical protein [Candidatus Nitrotoga fabula]|uniref:Uncharacterized protein n=1 Tax=Candidatus Nitrotoga fabula TaxID=2182327 RepID=A0A916BD12_9PROT|nr:conserved hypothetical protein [Candidatus Nitrotoga fabula]